MKISVIHPTKDRLAEAQSTVAKWIRKANTKLDYILCLDYNDKESYGIEGIRKYYCSDNSAIDAINAGAKEATGDIIIVISDDMDCPPNWDTLLIEALKGKSDFCAKVQDGKQDFIITLPIMDRIYYERYGYVYNPIYPHLYADTELSAVAWMTGKYLKLDLTFSHNHWTDGKRPKDAIDEKNYQNLQGQKQLFKQRFRDNFGLTDFIPLPSNSGLEKYRI